MPSISPTAPKQEVVDRKSESVALRVDVHSIGAPSQLEQFLVASMITLVFNLLRFLSLGGIVLQMCLLLPAVAQRNGAAPANHATVLFQLYIFVTAACIIVLFTSILLLWCAKQLLLGKVTHGMWPIWGWKMAPRRKLRVRQCSEACFKGLKAFEDWTFENPVLHAMYRTELPNVIMRMMGSKIGRGAYISRNVQDAPMICWELLSIGDNSVLDGCNIAGSSRIFHVHRPLTIGSDCATWPQ